MKRPLGSPGPAGARPGGLVSLHPGFHDFHDTRPVGGRGISAFWPRIFWRPAFFRSLLVRCVWCALKVG
ncbi:hypothetical protein [Pseudomonas phage PaBSM-2607-JFK]|nr:hypothetical protein [Pseudomonas phage PaBSM-2607-JFK]